MPHAELAAELVSLPSGLLAMVCEAIVRLKVRAAGVRACVHVRVAHGRWERAVVAPARAEWGRGSPRLFRDDRTACGVLEVLLVVPDRMLFRCPMSSESSCVAACDSAHGGRARAPESADGPPMWSV